MKRGMLAMAVVALLSGSAAPAAADWCVTLSGDQTNNYPFSDPSLFVRFAGRYPKKAGKIYPLHGRMGNEPVFGTATVSKSGDRIFVGATFFLDAQQGQFWMATQDVPVVDLHSFTYGYGDYQSYGVTGSTGVGTVVDCATEP